MHMYFHFGLNMVSSIELKQTNKSSTRIIKHFIEGKCWINQRFVVPKQMNNFLNVGHCVVKGEVIFEMIMKFENEVN